MIIFAIIVIKKYILLIESSDIWFWWGGTRVDFTVVLQISKSNKYYYYILLHFLFSPIIFCFLVLFRDCSFCPVSVFFSYLRIIMEKGNATK